MKVAFPLRNKRELAIDFVRCDAIGVYDDLSKKIEYLPRSSSNTSNDLCEQIKLSGVDCVVSPSFSCNALRLFKESNIKAYKAQGEALEGNISRFFSRMLRVFDIFDTIYIDECPSNCSGCK